MNLAVETAIVAVAFVVIFAIIHVAMMGITDIAMEHSGIFLCAALTGAAGHLLFEYTGLNQKYVDMRSGK